MRKHFLSIWWNNRLAGLFSLLLVLLGSTRTRAQPTVLGTQVVAGTYTAYNLTDLGAFRQVRLAATSAAATGVRNWEFAQGTAAAATYTTNWRPYTSGQTLAGFNQVIDPATQLASARYNTASGGASGLLPAVTSGRTYTFNVTENAAANNFMSVLETAYTPVDIMSVSREPASPTSSQAVTLTSTFSGTPNAAEYFYVRYSTDNFATSSFVAFGTSGNVRTATIPAVALGVGQYVRYYVFSSTASSTASFSSTTAADMLTLNLNNAGGNNYRYDYSGTGAMSGQYYINDGATNFTVGGAGTNFRTFGEAFNALNAYGIAGAVTFNVKRDLTFDEGRLVLNAVQGATATNKVTFQPEATGTFLSAIRPTVAGIGTNDAIVALNGADFITFDRIGIQENTANVNATTQYEFGYALFRASVTDGSQNNEIKGTFIFMNKAGNTATTGAIYGSPTYYGSTSPLTGPTLTNATGGNSSNKFNGNTISSLTSPALAGAQTGIYLNGNTTSSSYYDTANEIGSTTGNTISNVGGGTATTQGIRGEYQTNLKIENNTVTVPTGTTGSTAVVGINVGVTSAPGMTGTLTINNNTVSVSTAATGAVGGIRQLGTTNLTTVNITNNKVQNCNFSGNATVNYILDASAPTSQTVNVTGNQIINNTTSSTGTVVYINRTGGSGTANISGNFIGVTDLNGAAANNVTGASGTTCGIQFATSAITVNNNKIANLSYTATSGTFASTLIGVYTSSSATLVTITNNSITALSIAGSTSSTANTIRGISSDPVATSVGTFTGNTIGGFTLGSSGTTLSGTVVGMNLLQGSTTTVPVVSRNKIYGLAAFGASGSATGLLAGTSFLGTISNNLIGDLKAPEASGTSGALAVTGMNLSGGSGPYSVYNNTIYLAGTSSGTTFGTSGILFANATTPVLDLRNNLVVNTSTPTGASGYAAALRRAGGATGTSPANLASTSDYNLYNVGTPSASKLLYVEGTTTATNPIQTLAAYKTLMGSPKEANSKADAITPVSLFASTTGTDALFLHINPNTPAQVESGGVAISSITTDYDGDLRFGQTGYPGTSPNAIGQPLGGGTAPDVGADEGTFMAADLTAPSITYTALANTSSTTTYTLSGVAVTDASGVNIVAGTRPRLYFRRSGSSNGAVVANANTIGATNDNTTDGFKYVEATGAAGTPFSFTIDLSLLYLGATPVAIGAGDVSQYFVVAQDNATTPNVGINSGTFTTTPASVALAAANLPLTGTINSYTILATFSGPISVGTGQTYTSLTGTLANNGLFAAINAGVVTGNVTVNVTSDLTETGATALNQFATPYTLTIQADATTERLISGSYASGTAALNGLIRLNGADNVTITGTNASRYLRFRNTGSAPVLLLLNGANNNTLTYCTVEGTFVSSAAGTITLDGSTANSGNTFSYNDVRDRSDSPQTVSLNGFYASGTNQTVTIKGNSIRNFSGAGIFTANTAVGDGWVIGGSTTADGNQIYQEATRAAYNGIQVQSGSNHTIRYNSIYQSAGTLTGAFIGISLTGAGTGHTVSDNAIGGSAAGATGSALVSTNAVTGISLAVGGTLATGSTTVQSNLVRNITTSTTNGAITGITATSGAVNIGPASGSTGGNTIGDADPTKGLTASATSHGIHLTTGAATSNVRYNTVNNLLLSSTTSANTATTGRLVFGILAAGTAGIAHTVSFNTISNIVASDGTTKSQGIFLRGISVSGTGATPTVQGNQISSVLNNSVGTSGSNTSTAGLLVSSTGTSTVQGNQVNTVANLSTTAASSNFAYVVNGILVSGVAAGSAIAANRIWNVYGLSTSTGAAGDVVTGLQVAGSGTVSNNQISMPSGTNGQSALISGILDAGTSTTTSYYYNTVYLAAGDGLGSTYAFQRSSTTTVTLRNNILYNERTVTSGTSTANYAIGNTNAAATGWGSGASNYNLLVTADNTKVGYWLTAGYNFVGWKAASAGDANSTYLSPSASDVGGSAAALFNAPTAGDLTIKPSFYSTASPIESGGTALAGTVDNDYQGDIRQGSTGYAGTGTAPDLGSDEYAGTPAVNMAFDCATGVAVAQQLATTGIYAGTTNQQVLRVAVNTTGTANPLSATAFAFNADGTTANGATPANITNVKLFYTGLSSSFSTATQFGATATPTFSAAGDFTFSGTQVLQTGINYFFLTYDVPAGSADGNVIDGVLTGLTVGAACTVPAATGAPSGSRTILGAMSGTYTVGVGGTFTTITAAIFDLNQRGVSGPVIFSLINPAATAYDATAGRAETFPLTITAVTGSSSTNTVTFKPASGVQPVVTNATVSHTFRVTSAANIIFDGSNTSGGTTRDLTIQNTSGSATANALIWVASTIAAPVSNVQVRNLVLQGAANGATGTSAGVMVSSTTYNTATGGNANGIIIGNNTIQGTAYGVVVGNDATTPGTDLQIKDNLVGPATAGVANNVSVVGIMAQRVTSPIITGNTVRNIIGSGTGGAFSSSTTSPTGMIFPAGVTNATVSQNIINTVTATGSADAYGLVLGAGFTGGTVSRNQVLNVTGGSGSYGGHGIDINNLGSTTANLTLSNNMVASIGGTGNTTLLNAARAGITGIRIYNGTQGGINLYYNSVNLTAAATSSTASLISAAIYVGANSSTLDIRDNIFLNSTTSASSSGAKAFGFYSTAAKTAFTPINYNNYFVSGTQGVLGNIGGTGATTGATGDLATLAAFQATTGTGQDASSLNVDPQFINATNLYPGNLALAAGVPITGITVDYTGAARSGTAPTIGAYELVGTDLTATALANPSASNTCYSNAEPVTVTIKNAGTATLDFASNNATVTVNVTGTVTQAFSTTLTSGTLASGATQDVVVGNLNMTTVGSYTFGIMATVAGDLYTANDQLTPSPTRTVQTPTAGTAAASVSGICGASGSVTLTATGATGGVVTWYSSADGFTASIGTGSPLVTTLTAPASVTYKYKVVCTTESAFSSATGTVTAANPTISSTTGATRCGTGTVTLTATPSTGATINWYDTNASTTVLATGNTYSPTVSATRQYFAAAIAANVANTETAGRTAPAAVSGAGFSNNGLVFNASSAFTLKTVEVYPTAAGTVNIQVQDNTGAVIAGLTGTYNVVNTSGATPVTLTLNYSVPAGTGLRLIVTSGTAALVRELSLGGFPYSSPTGNVSVTSGYASGSSSTGYFYFYNWQVSAPCQSARTGVTATVNTPPALTYIGTTTICSGSSTTLTFSPSSYTNLAVSPTTGTVVDNVAHTITFNPTTTTAYTITGDDGTGAAGCTSTATATITVNPTPNAPTLTPSAPGPICAGSSTVVAASSNTTPLPGQAILTQNFNSGFGTWTATNNGGAPSTVWALITPPFTYSPYLTNWNGADGTQLAFANSDAGGSGSTTNTLLTSPSFSTVNFTAASLAFDHLLRSPATAAVQYSVSGGTWTDLAAYTSSQGTNPSSTTPTVTRPSITLPPAVLNQGDVRIRFNYVDAYGFYWAIDNVSITGTSTEAPVFAVTPTTGTSVSGSNITFNPTTTTTYSVTATFPSSLGCPSPATPVTITVNPRPTAALTSPSPSTVCAGSSVTVNTTLTGTAPYSVTVTTTTASGTTSQTSTVPASAYSLTAPLTQTTTFAITALTDANGCAADVSTLPNIAFTVNNQATYTGLAAGDGSNWFNPGNWSNGCVPNQYIDAILPSGLTAYPNMSAATTAEVRTLTLDNGAQLTQSAGTLAVYGNLTSNTPTASVTLTAGTIAFVSATAQSINGSQPLSFFNLTVNKASDTLRTVSDQTVRGTLALNSGILKTYVLNTRYKIVLTSALASALTETGTSLVLGDIEVPMADLSTNNATSSFSGLGLTLTARNLKPDGMTPADLPGTTTVMRSTGTALYRTNASGVALNKSIRRRYTITATKETNLNVDLVFGYNNSTFELNGISEGNLRLFSSATPTGPFRPEGGTLNTGAKTVTRTGLDHLSIWTLGDATSPLPVELTRFEAVRQATDAALSWNTASEKNNAGFEVQVSTDGHAFKTLSFVEGAGSSTAPRAYAYTDRTPGKTGLHYYRLRQVDLDGSAAFSPVRTVAFDDVTTQVSAAPNPFSQYLTLTVQARTVNKASSLTLTDASGRIVQQQVVSLPAGLSQLTLKQFHGLPAGLYLLQLQVDGKTQHLKVMKE